MARPERFELPTPRFEAWCSIQLSYERCLGDSPVKRAQSNQDPPALQYSAPVILVCVHNLTALFPHFQRCFSADPSRPRRLVAPAEGGNTGALILTEGGVSVWFDFNFRHSKNPECFWHYSNPSWPALQESTHHRLDFVSISAKLIIGWN